MDRPGRSESVRAAPGRNRTTVTVTSHGPVTVTARVGPGRDSRVPALSQRRTRTAAAAGTASSDSELRVGLKFKFIVQDSGFSAQPEGPPVQAGPVGSAGPGQ